MKAIIIGTLSASRAAQVLSETLKRLKDSYEAEFVVANVENAAAGAG